MQDRYGRQTCEAVPLRETPRQLDNGLSTTGPPASATANGRAGELERGLELVVAKLLNIEMAVRPFPTEPENGAVGDRPTKGLMETLSCCCQQLQAINDRVETIEKLIGML